MAEAQILLSADPLCKTMKTYSLEVEVIKTKEDLAQLVPEWEEFINEPVVGSNIYNDPVNVLLAAAGDASQRPYIVVVRDSGKIRCIAPFHIKATQLGYHLSVIDFLPSSVQMLSLFGDRFIYSKTGDTYRYFDAVFAALEDILYSIDLIYFPFLEFDTDLWHFCAENLPGKTFRFFLASPRIDIAHQIILPPNHEAYLSSLGSETRQNLRKTTRRFFEGGRARLERITDPDQVPRFLECLDLIFRNTWQAKTFGYQARNTSLQLQHLEQASSRGWLRSYVLFKDEAPVAYELGYQYRSVYYCSECGYDQRESRAGPGSILMHLVIEDLYKLDRPNVFDFGYGDARYKQSFANSQRQAGSIYLVPAGTRWSRRLILQKTLDTWSEAVRAGLVRVGLDAPVRKFLRHQGRK